MNSWMNSGRDCGRLNHRTRAWFRDAVALEHNESHFCEIYTLLAHKAKTQP